MRWKLGWSIIFLAIAYGILEEGLLMHSFYNHHHIDLDVLSEYGMFLKCQWPWAIQLTIYHGTVSTLIPIMVTDLLFPDLKEETFLGKKSIITISVLLVIETILMSLVIIAEFSKVENPYVPSALNIIVWTIIMFGFIYLANYFKGSYHKEVKARLKKPIGFAVNGFFFIPIIVIVPYIMANNNVLAFITCIFLFLMIFLTLRFTFRQLYHQYITVKHKVFLFAGVIIAFVLLSFFNQYVNGIPGMAATGIISFILMLIYCIVVISKDNLASE